MKHLQKFKTIIGISVAVLSFAVAPALAQDQEEQQQQQPALPGTPGGQAPDIKDDFSDETLEKFVDINQKLAPHQQEGEVKMIKAIEDKGLKTERFGEIMTAQQLNDSTNAGASADEMQKVEAAAQDIRDIQMELQQRMTKVIVDEGMEIQEFQDIILAYQYSPKVQKKINTLLEQSQGAPADSGQTTPAQPAPREE
ncbi:MAG TPA: DUF4168 domain-containing protein [Anseongella sp.]